MLDIKNDYGDYLIKESFPEISLDERDTLQDRYTDLVEKCETNETTKEEIDTFLKDFNDFLYIEKVAHKKIKTRKYQELLLELFEETSENFKTFGFSARFIDFITYSRINNVLKNINSDSSFVMPDINYNFFTTHINYKATSSSNYYLNPEKDKIEYPKITNLFDTTHCLEIDNIYLPFINYSEVEETKGQKVILELYRELLRSNPNAPFTKIQNEFTSKIKKQLFLLPEDSNNLYQHLMVGVISALLKVRRLIITINHWVLLIPAEVEDVLKKKYNEELTTVWDINPINKLTMIFFVDSYLEILETTKGFIQVNNAQVSNINMLLYQVQNIKTSIKVMTEMINLSKSTDIESISKEDLNTKIYYILSNNIVNPKDIIAFSPTYLEYSLSEPMNKKFGADNLEVYSLIESCLILGRLEGFIFPNTKDKIYSLSNIEYLDKILEKIGFNIRYSESIENSTIITGLISEITNNKNVKYKMHVSDYLLFYNLKDYKNAMLDTSYYKFNNITTNTVLPYNNFKSKKLLIKAKDIFELVHSPINARLHLAEELKDLNYEGNSNDIDWDI